MSGVQFLDVTWTGMRFVAIGSTFDARGDVFLDSTDGVTWHRQASDGPSAYLAALAAGPGGVVAVGSLGGRRASWLSPDGLTWTARSGAFPASDAAVTDVVATDAGWLAVGREDPACMVNCGLDPIRARAWTSSDGLHWKQVAHQAAFEGGGINAVARTDDGFVAAGVDSGRAAIWTSPDGLAWSRVPDDPMFHGGGEVFATGAAAFDGMIVVVGMRGGQAFTRARAWFLAPGRAWARASVERSAFGQMFSVVATPDGFLATGPSGDCVGGIWASSDGQAWQCVALDAAIEGLSPYAAAASGTVEVVVGLTDAGYDEDSGSGFPGTVWWRAIP